MGADKWYLYILGVWTGLSLKPLIDLLVDEAVKKRIKKNEQE